MARRPVACRIARRFKPSFNPSRNPPFRPSRPPRKRQRPSRHAGRSASGQHTSGQRAPCPQRTLRGRPTHPPSAMQAALRPPRRPGYRPHTSRTPAASGSHDARLAAAASMARFRRNALLFQEQIKGPENAPVARFDGLGCYRIGSENALVFSVRAAAGACWRRIGSGFGAALGRLARAGQGAGRAAAVWRLGACPGPVRKLAGTRFLLQKQEQIKGPENAPIARFDGLGCYRIGSENALVFIVRAASKTGWAAGLAAGLAA